MIKERYVNLEVARLLRDKGFNEHCYTYYDDIDDAINRFDKGYHFNNTSYPWGVPYDISKAKKYVVAPTQQMACDWIEETFNISIEVYVNIIGYTGCFCYALQDPKTASDIIQDDMPDGDNPDGSWSSKELAYNAALKYVLTNLI